MLKLAVIILLSAFALGLVNGDGLSILPFSSRSKYIAPRALSGPVEDCGVAQIVDIRVEGCTTTPCQQSRGSAYAVEVDFTSRDWHADMRIRAVVRKEAQLLVLEDDTRIPDSTLNPGQTYTFRFTYIPQTAFSGLSELRFKIYQNYVSEVCWVIPLNIL